jgi:hypothetical protein
VLLVCCSTISQVCVIVVVSNIYCGCVTAIMLLCYFTIGQVCVVVMLVAKYVMLLLLLVGNTSKTSFSLIAPTTCTHLR